MPRNQECKRQAAMRPSGGVCGGLESGKRGGRVLPNPVSTAQAGETGSVCPSRPSSSHSTADTAGLQPPSARRQLNPPGAPAPPGRSAWNYQKFQSVSLKKPIREHLKHPHHPTPGKWVINILECNLCQRRHYIRCLPACFLLLFKFSVKQKN